MRYTLPTCVKIGEKEYSINERGDFRVILDIFEVLNDKDFSEAEQTTCALLIFYNFNVPDDTTEALKKMNEFINCGECSESGSASKLMDWEHDFDVIVAAVNKSLGFDIRGKEYLHWWTFWSGYMEIDGESSFSRILQIRQKLKDGKLDKWDKKYYESNRSRVDLPIEYSKEEKQFLIDLLGGEF